MTLDTESRSLQKVDLLSMTMKEFLDKATERGLAMVILTDADEQAAAENLNNLAKGIASVEAAVKEARKPLKLLADSISAKGTELVALAERAKTEQAVKLKVYRDTKEAERQAALKAEAARQERERMEREAAVIEVRRKVELARLETERKQREAERLKWEAEQREQLAAAPMMSGEALDSEGVTQVAAGLTTAAQADDTAAKAELEAKESAERQVKADEELRLLEAQAQAAPSAPAQVIPSAPAQVKGIKMVMVPTIHEVDLGLLPLAYRTYDEAKIKKHLIDGIVIPGVKFSMAEVVKATKR